MKIEVFDYRHSATLVTKLSWFQKLICKWFNIEPVTKYLLCLKR